MGPLAREALRLPLDGEQRKLLVLIAAYADAGEHSPSLRVLGARLAGQERWNGRAKVNESGDLAIGKLDWLLRGLIRKGLLRVRWRAEEHTKRNVYELRLGEDGSQGRHSSQRTGRVAAWGDARL
jgi:hypothetical protein